MRHSGYRNPGKRILHRRFSFWLGVLLALLGPGGVFADPPVITTNLPPSPLLANLNTQVTLSISAVQSNVLPTAALSFQWRRNGANIPGTLTNISGTAVTTTYKLNNINVTDGGAYSVVVFNPDGVANSSVVNLIVTNPPFMPGGDNFGNRTVLNADALGSIFSERANNSNATLEPGEPPHGNVPGGRSIWYVWIPNQNLTPGVWTIDTRGSDFDTTLSVYTDPGLSVTDVTALASSGLPTFESDDANFPNHYHNSSVTLNVAAGQNYAIAIDGFYGAKGNVMLNFSRQFGVPPVTTIITQPHSQTVAAGSTATLAFTTDKSGFTSYQWFRNGISIVTNQVQNGTTNGSLVVSNITAVNAGQYQAFIITAAGSTNGLLTDPASIQINTQDGGFNPQAFALPKFREAADQGFFPLIHPLAAAVSGFTGTHIWNTFGAAAEPGEPNHCEKVGGAPYWFSYLAPGTGTLTVDANTPTYTNVLAVYTWPGFGDFAQLMPVTCASTNTGTGHEVSTFAATNGITYYLVVDGLNGAVGNVTLAYSLITPPVFTLQPQSQTVPPGSNVTLTASASGSPTPAYQWRTNTGTYLTKTNFSLTVSNFQAAKEGAYDVVATNLAGVATSSVAMLYLNSPLRFTNPAAATTGFTATLLGIVNTNYIIQANTNLATTNWQNIATNNSPYGILTITDTNYLNYSNRFFRALKK